MDRVTLRLPRRQVKELDAMVDAGEFPNRSEAIRTAVRDMLKEERERMGTRAYAPMPGEGD